MLSTTRPVTATGVALAARPRASGTDQHDPDGQSKGSRVYPFMCPLLGET
jgi:hypothetical protein